jgi:outer membrane immunogenic protein
MKQILIAGAALAVLAGSAFAADLPVKAPVVPAPVFSWTGPYIGINLGYSWGRETANGTATATATTVTRGVTTVTTAAPVALYGAGSLNGFVGGGQLGYNWQFGSWMVGLEGDLQATSERRTYSICTIAGCPTASSIVLTAENRLSWFGTDRVRLGFLPSERVFLYGTGGLAFGSFRGEQAGPIFMGPLPETWSGLRAGWTVGAGAEVAIDWNWSFKFEYLYMDFRNVPGATASTTLISGTTTTVTNFAFNERFTDNIFRVGLNYRFAPVPAAVVAKY